MKKLASSGVVGLTGGIGSGKSHVRNLFLGLGVPGIDADVLARDIHQDANHPAVTDIEEAFGAVLTLDGRMDRAKIRTLITKDSGADTKLKSILKPYIMEHLHAWTAEQASPYVIWESALIIEEHIPVDSVLTVYADVLLRRQRVRMRNQEWTDADIDAMFQMQSTEDFRQENADGVFQNFTDPVTSHAELARWHKTFSNRWSTYNV
jgi:dephospho-CoA kinase